VKTPLPRAACKCRRCEQLAALDSAFCDPLCERAWEHEHETHTGHDVAFDPTGQCGPEAWSCGMRLPLQNSA
jgi:hypothetical protein